MNAAVRLGKKAAWPPAPNNLPQYLTTFIGRGGDLAALKSMLGHSRMVSLTGPGGSGKSRLAAEVGRACLNLWPGGIWWVELAPVTEPRQVSDTVVAALELPGLGPAQNVVTTWLSARRALLVLDNCEHLVAACADFCMATLERCPELTIIATTREALGVAGEARWPVSSLRAPFAVKLFEARARLAVPDFRVVASNLETVTEICARLDGLPLAIELAAARMVALTEREILSQLTDRFRLLKGGNRTAPERQKTMAGTIDWSYRLLTHDEARLFRRLGVFRGGFTLESARAVCDDRTLGDVLDGLVGLVQKSMVVADRAEGSGSRYRLLESQLAYAEARLVEARELELMRRRHYEYFQDCMSARTDHPALLEPAPGVAEAEWIARESGNLWAAMGWARKSVDDMGITLAVDLAVSGFVDIIQARSLMADMLDHSPDKGVPRLRAFIASGLLAWAQGDYETTFRAAESCVALGRELGEVGRVVLALNLASTAHRGRADLGRAAEMLDEANSLLEGSSNRRLMTMTRNNVAWLAMEKGDYTAARDILAECLDTAKADGDVAGTAAYLDGLAWAQWGLNCLQASSASFKESLTRHHRIIDNLGTKRAVRGGGGVVFCLQGLSCVAGARGDHQRALRLAASAERMSGEWSLRSDPWLHRRVDDSNRQSRARLGARPSQQAWNEGWSMSLDQAVDYALGQGVPKGVVEPRQLSRREREIAKLVATGMTNREIAVRLSIAERTAEGHVEQIRNKLGFRSRTQVATWAVQHGLLADQTVSE